MKESHHFIYNLSDEMRSVFTYLALSVNFILFCVINRFQLACALSRDNCDLGSPKTHLSNLRL